MRARHVPWIGAVTATTITTVTNSNALGAMEHLDDAAGDAHIDLGADQRVRHRAAALGFEAIIGPDACQSPFGDLVIGCRQGTRSE
jgi:hypothetical protein